MAHITEKQGNPSRSGFAPLAIERSLPNELERSARFLLCRDQHLSLQTRSGREYLCKVFFYCVAIIDGVKVGIGGMLD